MSRDPGEKPRRPAAPPPPGSKPPRKPPEPAVDVYGLEEEPPSAEPAPAEPPMEPIRPRRPKSAPGKASRSRSFDDELAPASGGPSWIERFFLGSVSTGHLAQFCRQLAQYTDAGIPLLKALSNLQRQYERTALGPVLGRIHQGVKQGDSLHEAMGREPAVFDNLFLGTIRVAEARGGVPEALRRLAEHYESRQALIRQARSAMIYPIIVLTIAGGVIALITMFVLPAMMSGLEMKQDSLPGPTRALMGFSKFMQANGWWALPAVVVGTIVGLRQAYRTSAGKAMMDEAVLWLPVFGPLVQKIDTSTIARTLSVLLDAGVDAPSALNLTADVVHLTPYRNATLAMEEAIRDGSDLLDAMTDTRRFSPDVIARVEAGEQTGKLPECLDKLADDYDEQIALTVKNLGVLVQPLLMIILGGIVFFIALAFIMAYVSALQSASTL